LHGRPLSQELNGAAAKTMEDRQIVPRFGVIRVSGQHFP